MAQNLVELCTLLIETHLGDLSAQIFATLAEHGRLHAHTISDHAHIPVRRVRTGLASLLEEQLVLHHAAEEDAPAFYSVDWRNAYNLARHVNVIHLVTDRHGEGAGQVVKNILQLGLATVGDLAEAYDLQPGSKRDSGIDTTANHVTQEGMVNGIAKSAPSKPAPSPHVATASELHGILRTLLRSGILVKVGARAFMPMSDLQEQIEEAVIVEQFPDRKVTGPKKQKDFALAVNVLKRKWRDDDAFSELHDYASKGAIKRPGQHFTGPNKRAKTNGNLTNGHTIDIDDSSGPKLPSELIVRVDFTRCTLGLRSHRLQQLAKRYLGPATGAVYGALLQSLEEKVRTARDDLSRYETEEDAEAALPTSTIAEVADILDPAVDLGSSIKGVGSIKPLANGTGKKGKKNQVLDDEFADIGIKKEMSDSDEEPTENGFSSYRDRAKRLEAIEAHLMLLEEHSKGFCKRARPGSTSTEWRINFPALTHTLIETELDATITARHGNIALRIVRLLRERGKLDEKQVSALVMMRIKDVRGILTELQFQGFVDAQELPKDNTRQPSRTVYLWYFDSRRVQDLILQQTYKAMARILQRVPVERDRYRTIIEKAERSDIKGQEQEKLGLAERQALRGWREVEERLWVQVARCDEVVGVLRDAAGGGVEMVT